MTKLQMHIIRTINTVHNEDTRKAICAEYHDIYGSNLKEDYDEWRNRMQSIWTGNNETCKAH